MAVDLLHQGKLDKQMSKYTKTVMVFKTMIQI